MHKNSRSCIFIFAKIEGQIEWFALWDSVHIVCTICYILKIEQNISAKLLMIVCHSELKPASVKIDMLLM